MSANAAQTNDHRQVEKDASQLETPNANLWELLYCVLMFVLILF